MEGDRSSVASEECARWTGANESQRIPPKKLCAIYPWSHASTAQMGTVASQEKEMDRIRWWGRNVPRKARIHQGQHQGLNQANWKDANSNRTLTTNMKGQTDLKREKRSVGRWGNAFPPAPAELTVPISESVSGPSLWASGGSRPGAVEGLSQGNYHLLSIC